MDRSTSDGRDGFDPATYVPQFQEILEGIDRCVFSPHKAEIKATPHPGHFPGKRSPGYHLGDIVTYRVFRPAHPKTIGLIGQDYIEAYMIWGKEVELLAEKKLVGNGALGPQWSDADFRAALISYAVAAVRYRVFQNQRFFPKVKLRTVANTFSDETIPEEHRQMLFKRRSDIAREVLSDPLLLDSHILLIIVSMMMEDGRPVEDALRYLTNS